MAFTFTLPQQSDIKDPFDREIVSGSKISLTANRFVQDFKITTGSYISLSTRLYDVLCAENDQFANKISESAFQYYAVMLLWQRVGRLLPLHQTRQLPIFNKLLSYDKYLTVMPEALETYLRGIGNFNHPYFGEMRFRLPELLMNEKFDPITGTFGKITEETHYLYEAFPAPGIAALRVLADINYSTNTAFPVDPVWDLPENLRPDIEYQVNDDDRGKCKLGELKPTKNLLGWSPAQQLTTDQLELFRSLEIEKNISPQDLSTFFEKSKKLLITISEYFLDQPETALEVVAKNYYNGTPKKATVQKPRKPKQGFTEARPLPFTGSITQGINVVKVQDSIKFNRSNMYCDGPVSISSSVDVNCHIVTNAVVTGYRMSKEPISGMHCWACYDFDEYKNVPQSWIDTRNSVHTFGNVEGLDKSMWISGSIENRSTQFAFLKTHTMSAVENWHIHM